MNTNIPDYEPPTPAAHEYRSRSDTLGSEDRPSTSRALLLTTSSSRDSDEPPTLRVDKGKKVQWGDDPSTSALPDQLGHIVTDQDEEQRHLDEEILAAKLGHRLDIQDREPDDDPLYPDRPSYQQQIEGSVYLGVDPPPLPPLAEPEPAPQYPPIPHLTGQNPALAFPLGQ